MQVKLAAIAVLFLSASCTNALAREQAGREQMAAYLDAALFRLTASQLVTSSMNRPVRIDPRPLPADPDIVSLHSLQAIVPDHVTDLADTVPIPAASHARMSTLRAFAIDTTNAWEDAKCPGVMIPPTPEVRERKRQRCPPDAYESVVIAAPRPGGAFWPGNVDEREKYPGRVFTVRVISRDVTPSGSVEASYDYVYRCTDTRRCDLLEIKPLLIVE